MNNQEKTPVPGRLEGKVAFITGAAGGQGRAHAVRLASEGANIAGLDICSQIESVEYPMATKDDLDETVRLVEKTGQRMIGRVGDVRDRASLEAAYADTLAEFGRVDFVIANAGISPNWGEYCQTERAWQDCIDVMLTGAMNTVEVAIPQLVEQGSGGSIIITSSIASERPSVRTLGGKTMGLLGYCAAKAGVVMLMENYASMLGEHRIRVNTVHPSVVRTPMTDNETVRNANFSEEDQKVFNNALPEQEMEPEEIAAAVAWLCSDDSRFFTGSKLVIDGGMHLR
ncbi:mycofactocin-coupled SDR family oxidoreductase [Williamsia sp. D3]|uniref:mycofactocin-coupled SDR family oxidoreductase n=1 Tax=Williamsia sp. D3 TaxID=1313067 RepID=UPI0003D2FD3D|nr:mycofactocin-coupled SDR family oxidoreductase [Williamsia sp. D3]ETD33294.1 3-ketoacyl-ACP reductase [Williamsia sp. D3]